MEGRSSLECFENEFYNKSGFEIDKSVKNECLCNGESERGLNLGNGENADRVCFDGEKSSNHEAKKVCDDDVKKILDNHDNSSLVTSELNGANEGTNHKRKRDSLLETLKWLAEVAKGSAWNMKAYGSEVLAQALWARQAVLVPRHADSNVDQAPSKKKLRMHPSMFNDPKVSKNKSTERSRCSKRIPSSNKVQICSCCKPCPHTETELARSTSDLDIFSEEDNPLEKKIRVGSLYQAIIPEWTDVGYESDPKWTSTCVWPVEDKKGKSLMDLDSIGKGRQDSCSCKFPGSVDCVRFHITEKKISLKLELGSAFYHLGFNCMGEEVSLSWTSEEEKRFIDMVRLNCSSVRKFYREGALKYFPKMKIENLVSYYFNVFVIRCRSYQNRITPNNLDSDDESEFGSFSERYGHEAVKVPEPKLLLCRQNMQCTELE